MSADTQTLRSAERADAAVYGSGERPAARGTWMPPKADAGSGVLLSVLREVWTRLWQPGSLFMLPQKHRRLRVNETVSLGDKRFVSILEVDGRSYLIGGGSGSVALLASLPTGSESQLFERVLQETESR